MSFGAFPIKVSTVRVSVRSSAATNPTTLAKHEMFLQHSVVNSPKPAAIVDLVVCKTMTPNTPERPHD